MGRFRFAAGALPLILILAACSSAAATPSPTTQPAASLQVASQPAASDAGAGASGGTSATVDLKVAAGSGSVTNFLTTQGKTLYFFKKDTADSGKSACGAGPCLDNWPPFVVSSLDSVKPDSAVTGKLALIARDDGTMQVTYKGLPLYYFAGDKAAGDTNGSAIANWGVAAP